MITITQIETRTGVDCVVNIAAVGGINSLFVDGTDLSASLGVFIEWDALELDEAMNRVIEMRAEAGTFTVGRRHWSSAGSTIGSALRMR